MASSNPPATSLRINPQPLLKSKSYLEEKNPSPLALNGWININPREEGQCILALSGHSRKAGSETDRGPESTPAARGQGRAEKGKQDPAGDRSTVRTLSARGALLRA